MFGKSLFRLFTAGETGIIAAIGTFQNVYPGHSYQSCGTLRGSLRSHLRVRDVEEFANSNKPLTIPPERQIARHAAFAPGFRLVARRGPVGERRAPVGGTFGEPGEAARFAHLEQGPLHIMGDVAGEEEEAARLQQPVEVAQILLADEAAAMMARLGPGIGIEEIEALERSLRQMRE